MTACSDLMRLLISIHSNKPCNLRPYGLWILLRRIVPTARNSCGRDRTDPNSMEAVDIVIHITTLKFTTQVEERCVNFCRVKAIGLGIFAEGTVPVKASLQGLR